MKLFLILLLCSNLALAESEQLYKINNVTVIMTYQNGILANRDCLAHPEKCQAMLLAKKFAKASATKELEGKNPHSMKCKEVLKGEVIIGTDEDGNENSFCVFPDRSMISCSSLNKI